MNAQKILFPTDFSAASRATLPYAVSLARDCKAELIIAHVVEPGAAYSFGDKYFYGSGDPNFVMLKRMLGEVVPPDSTIQFRHELREGNAASEIVRLAAEEHVDLIVMPTHGWGGLQHLLMGSVAEGVVRRATSPVLTFKPSQAVAATKPLAKAATRSTASGL